MRPLALLLILPVVLVACQSRDAEDVTTDASDAFMSGAFPRLVAGPDGSAHMLWTAREDTLISLMSSRLAHGQSEWSTPVTVAQGSDWFVNWADFPNLAVTEDLVVAQWLPKTGSGTYAYEVRYATSRDAGETWSESARMHDDEIDGEHGFVSFAAQPNGSIMSMWLDGTGHALGTDKTVLQARELTATGQRKVQNLVDDMVCDCCSTTMVATEDGGVLAAYRDRTKDEIRDVFVAKFKDGAWGDPVAAANDGWEIAGCPVNGPMLDTHPDGTVSLAWFSGATGSMAVSASFSRDHGDSFGEPVSISSEDAIGRIGLVSVDGGAVVSWIQGAGEQANLMAVFVSPNGTKGEAVQVAGIDPARSSGNPQMIRLDDKLLFAWTQPGDVPSIVLKELDLDQVLPEPPVAKVLP